LQARLVKELRLAGISTIAAANAWLPGFITDHNARFGRDPANAKDLHRPLSAADDLDEVLAWREERTVTQNLTLHYDRMMLLLNPTPLARGLVRKKVEVVNYADGRFAVQFNGTTLGFKLFDKIQTVQPGAIVDNKRLSAVLEQVKAQQAAYPAHRQRGHSARQRPPNNLDAPGLPSKGRSALEQEAAIPPEAREMFVLLGQQIDAIDVRIKDVNAKLTAAHKVSEVSQRLVTIPGVGPVTALTLAVEIDPAVFESGRHLAAWQASRRRNVRPAAKWSARPGR
jgi:hypothetical protein